MAAAAQRPDASCEESPGSVGAAALVADALGGPLASRTAPVSRRLDPAACAFAAALLGSGVFLHPVLKLLYSQGPEFGKAKNSVVLRTLVPGFCIFGSIALSTLANYESYWTFAMLAPLEIVFVALLARTWQKVMPNRGQVSAMVVVLCGAVALTANTLQNKAGMAAEPPPDGWFVALFAAVLFRINQACSTIAIRDACVFLRDGKLGDVWDIALCKLAWACLFCIPYALATEGTGAFGTLASARGDAAGYLVLTVVLTCIFQTSNVGLNSRLRSLPATVLVQLQPLLTVLVAILLSGTALGSKLRLKWDASALNLTGIALLLAGALAYALASARAAAA